VGEYVAAFFEDPCSFVRVFFFDVMQGFKKYMKKEKTFWGKGPFGI
jgi:hypothetical protein